MLLRDDQALLRAQAGLDALQVVLPVVVVLVEDRDLRVRRVLGDPLAVHPALGDVVGLPAAGPRPLLVLEPPVARAGRDQRLGHLPIVQERPDRKVVLGSDRPDDSEDLVLEHELVRLLDRHRGVVAVVVELPDDLAAVDAALSVLALTDVDVSVVDVHPAADRPVGRGRAGERAGRAELDGRLRHARRRRLRSSFGRCRGGVQTRSRYGEHHGENEQETFSHVPLSSGSRA